MVGGVHLKAIFRQLAAALGAFSLGCCVTPPPAGKFFDRRSPTGTLKGFVYAVDAHQWRYAHDSLTEESRRELSSLELEGALRFLKVEIPCPGGTVRVPLYELVSNALGRLGDDASLEMGPGARRLQIHTKAREANGNLFLTSADLYFLLEEDEWRLDFLGSIGSVQSGLARAPPPEPR